MIPSFRLGIKSLPRSQVAQKWGNPQSGSRYLTSSYGEIHFRDEGAGPPLLLIHGIADSLHTWDKWVRRLKSQYRIIRLDLPGFGLSTIHSDTVGPLFFSDAIQQLLAFLKIDQQLLVAGNSLGGYLAGYLASERPELVCKLVLLDPAGYPMQKAPWMIEAAGHPVLKHLAQHMTPFALVKQTTRSLFADPSLITQDMLERFFDLSVMEGNRQSYVRIFEELEKRKMDYPSFIKKIRAPSLVIWGENDPWIPVTHADKWKNDLTFGEVKIYSMCGHMPQLEKPDESARDANDFFKHS